MSYSEVYLAVASNFVMFYSETLFSWPDGCLLTYNICLLCLEHWLVFPKHQLQGLFSFTDNIITTDFYWEETFKISNTLTKKRSLANQLLLHLNFRIECISNQL